MRCPSCNGSLTNLYMNIGDGDIYEVIQNKYICRKCKKIITYELKELK